MLLKALKKILLLVTEPTVITDARPTHPMDNPDWIPPIGPTEEKSRLYWEKAGQNSLRQKISKKINDNVAKNIIIFIGDGMSIATQSATRIYMEGPEKELSFEKFPFAGLTKVNLSRCYARQFLLNPFIIIICHQASQITCKQK